MTSIHEIFTTFGPAYLQHYSNTMPKTHRKVIDAVIACRSEACAIAFYQCVGCTAAATVLSLLWQSPLSHLPVQ